MDRVSIEEHSKALERLFAREDPRIRQDGDCPACRIERGVSNPMKVVAVLDAEAAGWLVVSGLQIAREEDTQLVFCPACHWFGYPSLAELHRYRTT